MEYTKEDIRVGPSRHGQGVFALRPFDTGDCIGPIHGRIVTDPEYGSEYGIDLCDGERTLEPAAPFRYLNHCCQPNSALIIHEEENEDGAPGDPVVWLEVLIRVAAGEPMTIDYAWPADAAIPCQCGSASCRGWIVAQDDLDAVVAGPK